MGLLTRLRDFTAPLAGQGPAGAWRYNGAGVTDAGAVADKQANSTSWSVRLFNEDLPGAVIDLIFCACAYTPDGRDDDDCYVQMRAEWINCGDRDNAASTATWSNAMVWDYMGGYPVGPLMMPYEQACAEAAAWADNIHSGEWTVEAVLAELGGPVPEDVIDIMLGWDGQPFEWED